MLVISCTILQCQWSTENSKVDFKMNLTLTLLTVVGATKVDRASYVRHRCLIIEQEVRENVVDTIEHQLRFGKARSIAEQVNCLRRDMDASTLI